MSILHSSTELQDTLTEDVCVLSDNLFILSGVWTGVAEQREPFLLLQPVVSQEELFTRPVASLIQ